jgi:hypothetical protein
MERIRAGNQNQGMTRETLTPRQRQVVRNEPFPVPGEESTERVAGWTPEISDRNHSDAGDVIALVTLATVQLTREGKQYALRQAVVRALRADLAMLEGK